MTRNALEDPLGLNLLNRARADAMIFLSPSRIKPGTDFAGGRIISESDSARVRSHGARGRLRAARLRFLPVFLKRPANCRKYGKLKVFRITRTCNKLLTQTYLLLIALRALNYVTSRYTMIILRFIIYVSLAKLTRGLH